MEDFHAMTPPHHTAMNEECHTAMHRSADGDGLLGKPRKKRRISRDAWRSGSGNANDTDNNSSIFPLASQDFQKCLQQLGRAVGRDSQEQRIHILQCLLLQLGKCLDSDAVCQPHSDSLVRHTRPIQSLLILHLGYTLSTTAETILYDISLALLCQCLCQLYKYACASQSSIMNKLLDTTEYRELLMLLSQILDLQNNCQLNKNASTVQACFGIIWFLQMSSLHIHIFCEMESILTSLVRVMSVTQHFEDKSIFTDALLILKSLSQQETQCKATTVYTAAHLITSVKTNRCLDSVESSRLYNEHLINKDFYAVGHTLLCGQARDVDWIEMMNSPIEMKDFLLLIRCLSISSELARRLSGCQELLDILQQHTLDSRKEDETFSMDAVECLLSIASHCGVCCSLELIVMFSRIVCRAPDIVVKRKALLALCHLVLRTDSVASLLKHLQFSDCNMTFDELVISVKETVMTEGPAESDAGLTQLKEKAAHMIELIFMYTAQKEEHTEEFGMIVAAMASLLHNDDTRVVDIAVRAFWKHTKDETLRLYLAKSYTVLTSLSHVLSGEWSPVRHKLIAAEALWNLTLDSSNLLVLVRNPKVVEALVKVASTTIGGAHNPTREPIRRCAVQTLVKLSNQVCNQRVLARQTGLLACLIRFVRALPHDDGDFDKDELKDRILKLAVLL